MCACGHAFTHVYKHAPAYVCMWAHVYTCVYVCPHGRGCVRSCTCSVHTSMCTHMYTCTHTHVPMSTCIHVHVFTCVRVCTCALCVCVSAGMCACVCVSLGPGLTLTCAQKSLHRKHLLGRKNPAGRVEGVGVRLPPRCLPVSLPGAQAFGAHAFGAHGGQMPTFGCGQSPRPGRWVAPHPHRPRRCPEARVWGMRCRPGTSLPGCHHPPPAPPPPPPPRPLAS